MKAEWKSVWTMCGALCAQTPGEMLMLQWYVGNWDILPKVYRPATYIHLLEGSGIYLFYSCKQMQWPFVAMHNLVLVLVQSTCTMLIVLVVKITSLTAHTIH